MDIISEKPGVLYKAENLAELNSLLSTKARCPYIVEIPITFLGIAKGPKALNNISIEKIQLGERIYQSISNPSFHSYKSSLNRKSICDKNLGDLLKFNDENLSGSIILVFKFLFDDRDEDLNRIIQADSKLFISIDFWIDFVDAHGLQLRYEGEITNFATGEIRPSKKLKRLSKLWITQANLFGLILFWILLTVWNFWLNKDVYSQDTNFFSNDFFAITLGVITTFLGLSIKKLKSFLAVFTDTLAFFKFPELHLSLEQFRGFSSKNWSLLFLIVSGLSVFLIVDNWSYKIPYLLENQGIYDIANTNYNFNNLEESQRIYRDHLTSTQIDRFPIILDKTRSLDKQIRVGSIHSNGFAFSAKPVYDSIKVVVQSRSGLNNDYEIKDLAIKLSENADLIRRDINIKEILVTMTDTLKNHNVRYFPHNSKAVDSIYINDYIMISETDISSIKESYIETVFKPFPDGKNDKYILLFRDREKIMNNLNAIIQKDLTFRHRIERKTLLDITNSYLKEINGESDKAIERLIIVRSMWDSLGDNLRGESSEQVIKEICHNLFQISKRTRNWVVARSSVDFLFDLQKKLNKENSNILLEFTVNELLKLDNRTFNLVDLIYLASHHEIIDNEIIKSHIKNDIGKISKQFNLEMYNAIIRIDSLNDRHRYDAIHYDLSTKHQIKRFCDRNDIKEIYNQSSRIN